MISYLPLAKLMNERQLSLSDLKKITGRNDGSLKIALCNGRYLKTSTLGIICKTLNCDIKDVITWTPGEQKGLGKAKKVNVKWDVLTNSLKLQGYDLTHASDAILHRSLNYLTAKRRNNKDILLNELKTLATYACEDVKTFISE